MDCQRKREHHYKMALLDRLDELTVKLEKTEDHVYTLKDLHHTRWPLGQRKSPSELKAICIELRLQQALLRQLKSEYDVLDMELIEKILSSKI